MAEPKAEEVRPEDIERVELSELPKAVTRDDIDRLEKRLDSIENEIQELTRRLNRRTLVFD